MRKITFDRRFIERAAVIIFWAFFLFLTGLYFTNDFGIVDLHKTSIIVAVGIDSEEGEVQVTAQLALPKASQEGQSTEYAEIQGSGETVADALNEINAKTGYYPKLQFCKLILLGDSCKDKNIFQVMGCFYRKNYSELTALVGMCAGKASDMLSMKTVGNDPSSTAIQKVLSDELKKSANVSSANLKDIAVMNFSESNACYMPYIEANKGGTSLTGADGDNVGGDPVENNQGGEQGGSQGGSGGQGGESGQGGQSGGEDKVEFTARRTALFRNGKFVTVLDEGQSFALDVLVNEIRLAILPCDAGLYHYTLGLKSVKGGTELKIEGDVPRLLINFEASAQIAGIKKPVEPKETASDDNLTPEIREGAGREIKRRIESLMQAVGEYDSDVLGIKRQLFISHPDKYPSLKSTILKTLQVEYNVNIISQN